MPLVQQRTPPTRQRRWQGTRTAFADLVASLEQCMTQVGARPTRLRVDVGGYEGELDSVQALRDELTEALWLRASKFTVTLSTDDWEQVSLSVSLDAVKPVLLIVYHNGSPQERETLRAVVERTLPEEPHDPSRHRRWIAPLAGVMYAAVWILIWSRVPRLNIHLDWTLSTAANIAVLVGGGLSQFGVGWFLSTIPLRLWFPAFEPMPDSAQSIWDRRRPWVQVGLGLWLTLVIGLLALPDQW